MNKEKTSVWKPGIIIKPPGPKTLAFNTRYEKVVMSALPKVSPLVVKDAKGALVRDIDGNVYIDFVAGFAVMSVGHCNSSVVKAVRRQASMLTHISAHLGSYKPYLSLAEKVRAVAPSNLRDGQIFFCNSGTEAVEAALKLAHHVTRRPLTVAFWPSFHGRTMGALSATGVAARLRSGITQAEMGGVYFSPYAYCYRCPLKQTYPSCGIACADYLENMFETMIPPEDTAAIIFEPISGEPGNIVPPPEFWPKIEKIARKYGILLIADEVYTGFGRTGKMFACEHWNIQPDIVVFAKAIAGGMPLGGIIARKELTGKWERGAHGSTFGGNPVSCAAGNAALDFIISHHLVRRAEELGNYMLERLRDMAKKYPVIGDVRGKGMMVAIELVKGESKEPATDFAKRLLLEAFQRGLLIYVAGTYDSVIRMMPPLIIEKEILDKGLSILDASLAEVSRL